MRALAADARPSLLEACRSAAADASAPYFHTALGASVLRRYLEEVLLVEQSPKVLFTLAPTMWLKPAPETEWLNWDCQQDGVGVRVRCAVRVCARGALRGLRGARGSSAGRS